MLFKKGVVNFPVHDESQIPVKYKSEIELHFQPIINGGVGKITKYKYNHNNKNGLFDLIEKHNVYSTWQAKVVGLDTEPGIRGLLKGLFHKLPFQDKIAFMDSYILKFGFLDGKAGYKYAKFREWYYYQTKIKRLEK
jgi:hypothetical protein